MIKRTYNYGRENVALYQMIKYAVINETTLNWQTP